MACPLCIGVGFFGGMIGEKCFGIAKPATRCGRLVSNLTNSACVVLTFVAIKKIFKVSVCAAAKSKFGKVILVGCEAILLGTLYAIQINKLCSKIFNPKIPVKNSSCCCSKKIDNDVTVGALSKDSFDGSPYLSMPKPQLSTSKQRYSTWFQSYQLRSWRIFRLFN